MGEIARTNDELRKLQQPVLEHMLDGIGHMKTFTGYLIEKPGRSELVLINKVLTPQIDKACSAFSNMDLHAKRLLDMVNKILEKVMVDHKKVSDDLKNLEIRQKKIGIEIKGKLDEIHEAEKNLNRKKKYLSNAKETLRNQESELESRKKQQKGAAIGGILTSVSAIPLVLVPGAGPFLAGAALVAGTGTQIVSVTVLEDAIEDQRNTVQSCSSEVTSCKSSLENAKDDKHKLEKEHSSLSESKANTEYRLKQIIQSETALKEYRDNIIEWNENTKRCVHDLTILYGRFKVLHTEVVGGYMVEALIEPTKDFCSSLISMTKCAGFRHLCDTADGVSLEIREIKKRLELTVKSAFEVDDLV